eukprot:816718-Prorocentrum_minimum.AAC.3
MLGGGASSSGMRSSGKPPVCAGVTSPNGNKWCSDEQDSSAAWLLLVRCDPPRRASYRNA